MSGNAKPTSSLSTKAPAAVPTEDLPVVQVYESGGVVVKWESEETKATHSTLYSGEPYFFRAFNSTGVEPTFKTFGSLLGCHGGVLMIGQIRYRVQAQQQQQFGKNC